MLLARDIGQVSKDDVSTTITLIFGLVMATIEFNYLKRLPTSPPITKRPHFLSRSIHLLLFPCIFIFIIFLLRLHPITARGMGPRKGKKYC